MLIPKCKKCSKSFKWSTILKASWDWGGLKPVECENCKTVHFIKPIFRIIIILIAFIPVLFEGIIFSTFKSHGLNAYAFWFYPVFGTLLLLLSPFFIRFYIKE
ncbi:TIGR04104 family putative zinc finger protein [Clostridium paridis]|uniref:CXXC-20-CXXC protein n=1 Tax=Clostridium paridis TaxID=2803863 RepID=A0A937FFY8_9CLOT|nr:hypothetical protein [Clostridium paridis]